MLFLTATDSIEAFLSVNTTTTVKSFVSYIDTSNDAPGNSPVVINGTTDTTLVGAPTSGQRLIKSINIYNGHSVTVVVTIQLDLSGTEHVLYKATLEPGQSLYYSPESGFFQNPPTAPNGTAKFWVQFDGTASSPITPDASYNVTNVTKSSTGQYTVNLSTPFATADYCAMAQIYSPGGGGTVVLCLIGNAAKTSSAVPVLCLTAAFAPVDPAEVFVCGFGDQ